ncbi:MAG: hypothetical protein HMLKMBBP_04007 [Planctomycetes bacterium]|nr:hypothetical protein [Planctomycetota bacterium]
MDENARRRAMATLQKMYEDLARRAVDTVNENEDGLRSSPFSFAYQEIEDRFAPRLLNLGHLLGAMQHLQRQKPQHTEFSVERVEGPLDQLDKRINDKLRGDRGATLHNVSLAQADDGTWHAFLTLSRTV